MEQISCDFITNILPRSFNILIKNILTPEFDYKILNTNLQQ